MQQPDTTPAKPLPPQCLNCGEFVPQNFCPNCGQERSDHIVPAGHLLHDAFDEFFKLDSKLGRTLIPLLIKPGFLTTEYISGRRVRYVSPFRLYFIVSALFFLVFSFVHYDVTVMHDFALGIEQLHPAHLHEMGTVPANSHMAHMTDMTDKTDGTVVAQIPAGKSRASRHASAVEKSAAWFIRNQTFITFLLVPIAALLMKLLYFGSKRLYVAHLVFAVHMQTFMFLLLIPSLLPYARDITYISALIMSALYLFIAMRSVYKQSVFATLAKCLVMLASYAAIMAAISFIAFLLFYSA